MTLAEDKLHGSGLYAQIATIQDTVKRFDEAMLTAATAAVPHGIDRLNSVLAQVPITIRSARPELVTDVVIARIFDKLSLIGDELNDYISDANVGHLANALGTEIDNLIWALRANFSLWQPPGGRGEPSLLVPDGSYPGGTAPVRAGPDLDRTRLLDDRFTAAAAQLGDATPSVRLAGVHAMAGLADDWPENRQACVDVLCAYLRRQYEPDPGDRAGPAIRRRFQAEQQVRHSAMHVIAGHLREDAPTPWAGLWLDLTGAVFDGAHDLADAVFSGGTYAGFDGATFADGCRFDFGGARFAGGAVSFRDARFLGCSVSFSEAEFSASRIGFVGARFSGGTVSFERARFSGGTVSFGGARFSGGMVSFGGARFSGGTVRFPRAEFPGSLVSFDGAQFSAGFVGFDGAQFSGGTVSFEGARFSGGQVWFRQPGDWSVPPELDFDDLPPGVVPPDP